MTEEGKAVEENLRSFLGLLGRLPDFEHHDEAAISWTISRVRYSFFNSFLPRRSTGLGPILSLSCKMARARAVPILWWAGPSGGFETLSRCLSGAGFIHDEDLTGMVLDPGAPVARAGLPRDFSAVAVAGPEIDAWRRVAAGNFGMRGLAAETLAGLVSCLGFGRESALRNYLGSFEGRPVATATVFRRGDVAGLYNVSTLPEARGKGLGTALTRFALLEARSTGAARVVLQATGQGVGLYRRLGFREVCRFGNYIFDGHAGHGRATPLDGG